MPDYQSRWDNSAFFSGSDDPQIAVVVDELRLAIDELTKACQPLSDLVDPQHQPAIDSYPQLVDDLDALYQQQLLVTRRLRNTSMFVQSCLSVNARDAQASTWLPVLQQLGAQMHSGLHPMYGFLARADQPFIELLNQHERLADLSFKLSQLREMKDQLLPVEQEQLLTGMAVTGLHGWGNLYKNLAGTLQCQVGNETLGLAAANQLANPERDTREQAWRAINQAWSEQEQSVAAILNNINGWRIEEGGKRAVACVNG